MLPFPHIAIGIGFGEYKDGILFDFKFLDEVFIGQVDLAEV
jgi:hypothetical protein